MKLEEDGLVSALEMSAVHKTLFFFFFFFFFSGQDIVLIWYNSLLLAYFTKQGESVSKSLCHLTQDLFMDRDIQKLLSKVHSRQTGYGDGLAKLPQSDYSIKVITSTLGTRQDMPGLQETDGGPLSNQKELESANMHVSSFRSIGMKGGLVQHP